MTLPPPHQIRRPPLHERSARPAVSPRDDRPPADAPPQANTEVDNAEYVWGDLRCQAIERMRKMNVRHGTHAWDQRRSDPLSPYGLAYLFMHPTGPTRPGRYTLAAATRLFLHGPENENFTALLYDLIEYVNGRPAAGIFDIRDQLTNRADPMPTDAIFCGIGLSSLDTGSATWAQVCRTEDSPANIGGRIIIVMNDHTERTARTFIAAERLGRKAFNEHLATMSAYSPEPAHPLQIVTNASLEVAPGHPMFPSRGMDIVELAARSTAVFDHLHTLSETLWSADNSRLVAQKAARLAAAQGHRP